MCEGLAFSQDLKQVSTSAQLSRLSNFPIDRTFDGANPDSQDSNNRTISSNDIPVIGVSSSGLSVVDFFAKSRSVRGKPVSRL